MKPSALTPVRKAPAYRKQRHLPGIYWFSTTGEHVIYESRMEMRALIMLDFDPNVVGVVAQPFALVFAGNGKGEKPKMHIPDYLADCRNSANRVIDVKPAERASKPDKKAVFEATQRACAVVGWDYEVVSEHDPVLLANVEWLSGFRRVPLMLEDIAPAVVEAASVVSGRRFWELMCMFQGRVPEVLARPVVLHLLWTQVLRADLSTLLLEETIVRTNMGKEGFGGS